MAGGFKKDETQAGGFAPAFIAPGNDQEALQDEHLYTSAVPYAAGSGGWLPSGAINGLYGMFANIGGHSVPTNGSVKDRVRYEIRGEKRPASGVAGLVSPALGIATMFDSGLVARRMREEAMRLYQPALRQNDEFTGDPSASGVPQYQTQSVPPYIAPYGTEWSVDYGNAKSVFPALPEPPTHARPDWLE